MLIYFVFKMIYFEFIRIDSEVNEIDFEFKLFCFLVLVTGAVEITIDFGW